MVARSEVERGLQSTEKPLVLQSVREIRNQVIGDKQKKRAYVGVVEQILHILDSQTDSNLKSAAAAVIGSISYHNEAGVKAIVEHGGVDVLLKALLDTDESVVSAAARALKLVYQSPLAPHQPLLREPVLQRLTAILVDQSPHVAEVAAVVLARCCDSQEEANRVHEAGAAAALFAMLGNQRTSGQQAAMEALAALCNNSPAACQQLLEMAPGAMQRLLDLTRQPRLPRLRLLGASCVAALSQAAQEGHPLHQVLHNACRCILPGLVRLLSHPEFREDVPALLARLVATRPDLLRMALDADAVRLLAAFLAASETTTSCSGGVRGPSSGSKLRAGCLRALGVLGLASDAARQQLLDAKVLPLVAAALQDGEDGVRAGATLCAHALSRSVSSLRGQAVEAEVAVPLCKLLSDGNVEVQVHATAAMCNLVLELSGVRDAVLASDALQQLAPLTSSMIPEVRLNAIWALKNLTADCEDAIRLALLRELPWAQMQALVRDCEPGVQDQAVALLQNLCKASGQGLQAIWAWSGGELLVTLEERLDPCSDLCGQQPGRLLAKVLFTVANVCSGLERQKDMVMCSNIPSLLLHHLRQGGEGRSSSGPGADTGVRGAGPKEGDAARAGGSSSSSSGRTAEVNRDGPGSSSSSGEGTTAPASQLPPECMPEPFAAAAAAARRPRSSLSRGGLAPVPCVVREPFSSVSRESAAAPGVPGACDAVTDDTDPCEVPLAAVWCVINLLWADEGEFSEGVAKRAAALRDLGVGEALQGLQSAASQDLRERVCTALEQLAIKP